MPGFPYDNFPDPSPSWPSVAAVEDHLLRWHRETLDLAGLDAATADGTNPDLAGPVALALRQVGVRAADPLRPLDSDIALVPQAAEPAFLLACRIEALEAALGRLHAQVDLTVGGGSGNSYRLSQAASSIQRTLDRLRAQFTSWYETGAGRTEAGDIDSRYHSADSDLLTYPYSW
jgi:hypothetical protein